MKEFEIFADKLVEELKWRYDNCSDAASASSLLLAVLNAVAEARKAVYAAAPQEKP